MGVRCVVLAAGRGSRLGLGRPKPLVPVLGLTLVERVLVTAADAGADEFVVVTGYEAERVEEFLADLAVRRGMRIEAVRNEQWALGNGTSALAARRVVTDEFLLVMGDHVFDKAVLERLIAQPVEPGGAMVAADYRTGAEAIAIDDDATKLLVDGERVLDIGKTIPRYNAYDTGAFRFHPALFDALEASIAGGDGSLSGGVHRLARQGCVRAVDIGAADWVDVDTAADAHRAVTCLRRKLAKPEDGIVSRLVNRPLSGRVFTPLLLRLWPRITANQVSLIAFAVALAASASFLARAPVLAGLMVALASILDGSDGEVARIKQQRSGFGGYLDAVLDRYADTAMLAAATAFLVAEGGGWFAVAAGSAAACGNLMVSYTSARSVVDLGYRYASRWIAAGRGRDVRLFILSAAAVLAPLNTVALLAALVVLAVLTNAIVAARLALSWQIAHTAPLGQLDAVIFDLDGTIADTMPALIDLALDVLDPYGLPRDEARRRYLDTAGVDFATQLAELFPAHPRNAAAAAEFEARKQRAIAGCAVFRDAAEMLGLLEAAGLRRFVASSTRAELVAEYLRRRGIDDWFDDHAGWAPGHPKDRQVECLLDRHGLAPERVLFVGDSPRDADLLKRTGVRFVGLERLFGRDDFRRRGVHSVPDLHQLTRLWRWHYDVAYTRDAPAADRRGSVVDGRLTRDRGEG